MRRARPRAARTPDRRATLLAAYDDQLRAHPPPEADFVYELADGVVRALGAGALILYSKLDAVRAAAVIARECSYFERLGRSFEWKVYAHDEPPDLGARLRASGFVPQAPETFMIADLAALAYPQLACDLRLVTGRASLRDLATVQAAAFSRPAPSFYARFEAQLGDPALRLFVIYAGGRPVSGGRLQLPPGRDFASLWGGGTIPEARGRGFFRALVTARAAEARRLGYRYLTVDAVAASRPILERLGFRPLAEITGWIFTPVQATARLDCR